MYVILSHPAYTNKKYKLHKHLPTAFKAKIYTPKIATVEPFGFALNPPRDQWWKGSAEAALTLIPACIELGENPLILDEQAMPEPAKVSSPVLVPRNLTASICTAVVQAVGFCPEYELLFNKLSQYLVNEHGKIQLNSAEISQLFRLLRIEPIREQERELRLESGQLISEMETIPLAASTISESKVYINSADYTATDDDIRPKGASLFDFDDLDEEGELEPEQEQGPEPTPEPTPEPEPIVQSSCYADPNSPEFKQLQAETEAELQRYYASRPLSVIDYNDSGRSILKTYKEKEKTNRHLGRKLKQGD